MLRAQFDLDDVEALQLAESLVAVDLPFEGLSRLPVDERIAARGRSLTEKEQPAFGLISGLSQRAVSAGFSLQLPTQFDDAPRHY